MNLVLEKDYYLDEGQVVFTSAHHIKRGFCCGDNCKHCPFISVKGETTLRQEFSKTSMWQQLSQSSHEYKAPGYDDIVMAISHLTNQSKHDRRNQQDNTDDPF